MEQGGDIKISKSKIFLFCCIAFIVGIAIASFLAPASKHLNILWFSIVIILAVLTALFWQKKALRTGFLIVLFLFLGLWRFGLSLPAQGPDKIWHYNGQSVVMQGYLSDEPDIRAKNQKLEFRAASVSFADKNGRLGQDWPVFGKVLLTTDLYPEYKYGQKLEVRCNLQAPEEFNGFAYDRYLARYDIYSLCYYPQITRLEGRGGNIFYRKIFLLKDNLRRTINQGLSEPEAGLAKAVILGDKKGIGDDLRLTFSRVGLSHIVAISGMHISILSLMLMRLLLSLGLPRRYAFYIATLFLAFYIILIGMPASAVRAGLMGFLVLWSLHLGRLNRTINALVFSAVLLLLVNPALLRADIGFQLSFLAVLGIIYCYPKIESWLKKIKLPKAGGLRGIFSITLAAQIFTLPVLVLNFSLVSLIAPVANIFVLWTLPFLLVATLLGLGLSLLFSSLSAVFFLATKFIIGYILKVSVFLEDIPYSFIEFDNFQIGWPMIFFIIVIFLFLSPVFKKKKLINF